MGEVVLAVVGTRVLACPGDAYRAEDRVRYAITRLNPTRVISGGAAGVDSIAERVALEMGYFESEGALTVYRPKIRQFHGPGGYRERDQQIAEDCTHLLRIACRRATTYGSGWTADHAEKLGKTVVRDTICPTGGA